MRLSLMQIRLSLLPKLEVSRGVVMTSKHHEVVLPI